MAATTHDLPAREARRTSGARRSRRPTGAPARGPSIDVAALADAQWRPAPIAPDWIRSGDPVTRSAPLSRSADGAASTWLWDCTAGSFRWEFGACDETVLILEGEVRVTGQDGVTVVLREGDTALFPAGTTAVWEVDAYVKKIAFCRRPFPHRLVAAARAGKRLLRRI